MSIQCIVTPVDFSDAARQAAVAACRLAERWGATLLLVHVDELPDMMTIASEPVYAPRSAWTRLETHHAASVEQRLQALEKELCPVGIELRHDYLHAALAEGIADYAAANGASLIILGSRGDVPFTGGNLGDIVDEAPCPVLVIPEVPPDVSRPPHVLQGRHTLIYVEPTGDAETVARAASSLTHQDGQLTFVHVWPQPPLHAVERGVMGHPQSHFVEGLEQTRAALTRELRELASTVELPQTRRDAILDTGEPAVRVPALAREHNCDLVVVPMHRDRSIADEVAGAVPARLLGELRVPILFVPTAPR